MLKILQVVNFKLFNEKTIIGNLIVSFESF